MRVEEGHQIHFKILFQTEGKGSFIYFINLYVNERTKLIVNYYEDPISNIYSKRNIKSSNSMIWNEADYRWRTCEHAGDSKIWPESPRLDSRRSGCKLCDFELNINAFSGLLFCYLENKGAKLVDRFPPPLNTYDINCKSFSFFFNWNILEIPQQEMVLA